MAFSPINNSDAFFNSVLVTGQATNQAITGLGHQPDFLWSKRRDNSGGSRLKTSVRGTGYTLFSDGTDAESNESNLVSFDSDGYTAVGGGSMNENGATYVTKSWKLGTTSGLTGGTITPSAYSINATAGQAVIYYQGNGSAGATVPHGLGKKPGLILVKRLDASTNWRVYSGNSGATYYAGLNQNNAFATSTIIWNDTEPTTNLFSLGTSTNTNNNGSYHLAYVFADVPGYFMTGSYNGNSGTGVNGKFVYTGGRPKALLIRPNIASKDWYFFDQLTNGYNPNNRGFYTNYNNAEANLSGYLNFHAQGFMLTTADNSVNNLGNSYQFWCWMQPIVGSNNVPNTGV